MKKLSLTLMLGSLKLELLRKGLGLGLLGLMISSCSKTSFKDVTPEPTTFQVIEIPVDPDPVVPDPDPNPIPTYMLSGGACNSDSSTSLLSCMKCEVPVTPPGRPQLSAKAQALVDAMYLSCQIANQSDRNNFRPTKDMLVNKLNRGSQDLFPESTRTSQMAMVVAGLTNESDDSLRRRMFGGLWYQPPYSDAFETYFGLTVQEAKSTFCWDGNVETPQITGVTGVSSKQYIDCLSSDNWSSCTETPAYVTAQTYRTQLNNVLSVSISDPYVAPLPSPTASCQWQKFNGNDISSAKSFLAQWKSEGRTVSLEFVNASGVGQCGVADASNLTDGLTVAMAAYRCD